MRLVVIDGKALTYAFWYGRKEVAVYQASAPLDADEVEQMRRTHPLPPREAA